MSLFEKFSKTILVTLQQNHEKEMQRLVSSKTIYLEDIAKETEEKQKKVKKQIVNNEK